MRQLTETLAGALLHPRAAAREARQPNRPRMLWHQDLVTCVLAMWLIQGLTMDAWAHTNQTRLETVVTPWHAHQGLAAREGDGRTCIVVEFLVGGPQSSEVGPLTVTAPEVIGGTVVVVGATNLLGVVLVRTDDGLIAHQ